MVNAIIDQNFAKNWDTVRKNHRNKNVRKRARLYPLRERKKPFVIVKLARNITLLISAKVLSCCVSARKGN